MDDIDWMIPRFLYNPFGPESPFLVESEKKRQLLKIAAELAGRRLPLQTVLDRVEEVDRHFWIVIVQQETEEDDDEIGLIKIYACRPAWLIAEQIRAHYQNRSYRVELKNGIRIEFTDLGFRKFCEEISSWGDEPVLTHTHLISFVDLTSASCRHQVQ